MTKLTTITSLQIKTAPGVCVIICIHNAPDYAEICIESVLRHTRHPYELILVNDGSRSETSEIIKSFVREYDHIRLIHHSRAQGYTKAANAGLKTSQSDYTILLNSDTIVSPGWTEKLIACAESDKKIGIVGPLSNAATYQSVPYVFEDDGTWKQNILPGDVTVASYANAIEEASVKSYPRVPVANGFCFMVKRSVIDTIGYLDEETFPRGYGEENDYCLRAADAGFEIAIADNAYVYHATSKSFGRRIREKLTREAHHAIRSKYSTERLDNVDHTLRNHSEMDAVRTRVQQQVYNHHATDLLQPSKLSAPKPNQELSFLFLAPDCTAKSGGTQMIVDSARGLHSLGVSVKIAAKYSIKEEYDTFFPADSHLFYYYDKDSELLVKAKDFNVSIATIFHSVRQLEKIMAIYPHMMAAYYVQDYEPWFYGDRPKAKELAEQSYTMVANNHLFAISPWVQEVVMEKHGQMVHKIQGCLDQSLFHPDYSKPIGGPVVISAMVRPTTPWRGPKLTMQVLKALKETHGDKITIRIFGCNDHEFDQNELDTDFEFDNYGILNHYDVATLLRRCDVFMDLSEFQAFGRTALEAMACGCAVIAPERGGVKDFATHGENSLLIDTSDVSACLDAASLLIKDADFRLMMQRKAIQTGLDYSIQRSTLSFLDLMYRLKQENSRVSQEEQAA